MTQGALGKEGVEVREVMEGHTHVHTHTYTHARTHARTCTHAMLFCCASFVYSSAFKLELGKRGSDI